MTDQTGTARSALREAIAARASARATHQAATDALARADAMLVDLDVELERHAQTSEAAEAQRADEIAAAIKRGSKPNVSLSKAAQEARHAQADIASRQSMAQAARARLAAELEDAKAALTAAERAVLRAAAGVIGSEAIARVGQFRAALHQLNTTADALAALTRLGVNLPVGTPLPPYPAAVQSALLDLAALEAPLSQLRPVALLRDGPRAVAVEKLATYFAALAADPDVAFEDIVDPSLPREAPLHAFAPAPITREQPWVSNNGLSDALLAPRAAIA